MIIPTIISLCFVITNTIATTIMYNAICSAITFFAINTFVIYIVAKSFHLYLCFHYVSPFNHYIHTIYAYIAIITTTIINNNIVITYTTILIESIIYCVVRLCR